jgi:hypothetical protein
MVVNEDYRLVLKELEWIVLAQNAYIKLVPASLKQTITIDDVRELFSYYKDITNKTAKQLSWKFDDVAFPYQMIETKSDVDSNLWFYLKSTHPAYNTILIGVDKEDVHNIDKDETSEQTYIQITIPETATQGDKGKANEFCKFLSKKLQGELHLFNGRIMYYYKR